MIIRYIYFFGLCTSRFCVIVVGSTLWMLIVSDVELCVTSGNGHLKLYALISHSDCVLSTFYSTFLLASLISFVAVIG